MDDERARRLAFLAGIVITISTALWVVVLAATLGSDDNRSSSDRTAAPHMPLTAPDANGQAQAPAALR